MNKENGVSNNKEVLSEINKDIDIISKKLNKKFDFKWMEKDNELQLCIKYYETLYSGRRIKQEENITISEKESGKQSVVQNQVKTKEYESKELECKKRKFQLYRESLLDDKYYIAPRIMSKFR